jgi:hypothetical protein
VCMNDYQAVLVVVAKWWDCEVWDYICYSTAMLDDRTV